MKVIVDEILSEIRSLLNTCDDGRIIKEGIQTVILGKPNAGKSSLLNVLLGEDRAIVTDIAGTTRDILEEHINLQGISLNIMDTAGIRNTKDIVEKIGVDKAKNQAETADLILYVIDASASLDENDIEILKMIQGKQSIILLNKTDLDMIVTKDMVEEAYFASFNSFSNNFNNSKTRENSIKDNKNILKRNKNKSFNIPLIEISAKNHQGIEKLEETLKCMFFEGNLAFNDEIYITNIRHKTALQDAYESLTKVNESIEMGMPEDFYSIDLMDAYEALGSITGETIGEDLINEIFSKFCMGK